MRSVSKAARAAAVADRCTPLGMVPTPEEPAVDGRNVQAALDTGEFLATVIRRTGYRGWVEGDASATVRAFCNEKDVGYAEVMATARELMQDRPDTGICAAPGGVPSSLLCRWPELDLLAVEYRMVISIAVDTDFP